MDEAVFWQRLAAQKPTAEEARAAVRDSLPETGGEEAARQAFAQGAAVRMLDDGASPGFVFVVGRAEVLDAPCVAVVGTRRASGYGNAAAHEFARCLAAAGVTVVSGGALGNDVAAHAGALEAGATAAVLPCGADVAYPSRHAGLYDRIRASGCLVSEFPFGHTAAQGSFLDRNRTIARLSAAVLVVEAPEGSGALSTARHALEMGKQAAVVPGPYTQLSFRGGHALLAEGARLADDPWAFAAQFGAEGTPGRASGTEDETGLLACLESGPMEMEALVRATGLDVASATTALTLLEIEGRVRRVGTGYALSL